MTSPIDSPTCADKTEGAPIFDLSNLPLYVDLDGTIISTDVLWESFVAVIRHNPLMLVMVPLWLLLGARPRLKKELARRANLDVSLLPYRPEIVDYLRGEKARSRKLILATAADRSLGQAVADHLGLFDGVMGSEGATNLKSRHKLAAILQQSPDGFAYAGDSHADLVIWAKAGQSLVVEPSPSVLAEVQKFPGVTVLIPPAKVRPGAFVQLVEPLAWIRNLLVFAPILFARRSATANSPALIHGLVAFAALSFCTSSAQILGQALNVRTERLSSALRLSRPLAAGVFKLPVGLLSPVFFLVAGILLVAFLPHRGAVLPVLLLLYWLCNAIRAIYFERRVALGLLMLAVMYVLIVAAGELVARS